MIGRRVLIPKQVAGGKLFYESKVGFEKIVSRKIFGWNPLDVPENSILDFSLVLADDEEAEVDHASIGIGVLNATDFVTDGGQDSELFFQFAMQGGAGLFSFFDLSSVEFPLHRHGLGSRS